MRPSMVPSESIYPSQNPSDVPSCTPSTLDPTSTPVMMLCFVSPFLNFAMHEAAATILQGDVVSIHSAEENWLVADIRYGSDAYIGLVDYALEGTFVWTDGSDVNFTNYRVGEPNNNGGGEDCTSMYSDSNVWNDMPCYRPSPAVYKLPSSSLFGAITAGYTCYEGDSTGCTSSLNCKTELTICPG
eukprot:scaffold421330_cov55-Attheya_sp.AAC.1